MTEDPYQLVAALGVSLRADGFPDWARAIDDAVAGGATGTEVLMALRWITKRLLGAGLLLSPALRAQARALAAAIDDALKV